MFCIFALILLLPHFSLQSCSLNGNVGVDQCVHGVCGNSSGDPKCICQDGWSGPLCEYCTGRTLFNISEGFVSDGWKNYTQSMTCSWLVQPVANHSSLKLQFLEFATECGWDYLYIYDGDSAFSPLLGTFNGLISTNKMNQTSPPVIVAKSGTAFIQFHSDAAYHMLGFNISFTVDECPRNCSNRGTCVGGFCSCNDGWSGEACDQITCGRNFTSSNHWTACGFDPTTILPRASYAAVNVDNHLWVYGGYYFSAPSHLNDLLTFNITEHAWSPVVANSSSRPSSRYGHTMVSWNGQLLVFGGKLLENESTVDQLWQFDISQREWSLVNYSADFGLTHPNLTISNLALFGHSADIVRSANGTEMMVVMFGYNSAVHFSPFVYEYNPQTKTWSFPPTNGVWIGGLFGHSSVYDTASNTIFVHGGYTSSPKNKLSSSTYAYDPVRRTFTKLASSDIPRFLHAAVLVDGVMYVYGGNTHNDTSSSTGALCYSPDAMSYSLACDRWTSISLPSEPSMAARYGHKGVAAWPGGRNETPSVYFFSGYDSTMLSNTIVYRPGRCPDQSTTEQECTNSSSSHLECLWNGTHCLSGNSLNGNRSCTRRANVSHGQAENKDFCSSLSPDRCLLCDAAAPHCNRSGKTCVQSSAKHTSAAPPTCDVSEVCDELTTCDVCTRRKDCMWCANLRACVHTGSYVVRYAYGQCQEWTNSVCRDYRCRSQQTCQQCQEVATCGWCDDGSDTGRGFCTEGSMRGPLLPGSGPGLYNVSESKCPAPSWYFTSCPFCQCNGHSTCNDSGVCVDCQDNTAGPQCETCSAGHYGNALNGGECRPCQCGGKATACNPSSGVCYCSTKGVSGPNCDRCDVSRGYEGDATGNGTCFYRLTENYQFTFTMTKSSGDEHVTAVNFINYVTDAIDLQVTLEAAKRSNIRLTFTSVLNGSMEELTAAEYLDEDQLVYLYSASRWEFTRRPNNTIRIYVSNFTVPCWIKISLLQKDNRLLHILLILFSSFLIVLFLVAVAWKAKITYDAYQLRNNQAVERREMAARPFAGINLSCDDIYSSVKVLNNGYCELRNEMDALCEEKLANDDVSVVSVFLALPCGVAASTDDGTGSLQGLAPSGQSPIAVGTTLLKTSTPERKRQPLLSSRTDLHEGLDPTSRPENGHAVYVNSVADSSSV